MSHGGERGSNSVKKRFTYYLKGPFADLTVVVRFYRHEKIYNWANSTHITSRKTKSSSNVNLELKKIASSLNRNIWVFDASGHVSDRKLTTTVSMTKEKNKTSKVIFPVWLKKFIWQRCGNRTHFSTPYPVSKDVHTCRGRKRQKNSATIYYNSSELDWLGLAMKDLGCITLISWWWDNFIDMFLSFQKVFL